MNKEQLQKELASLEGQANNALAVYNQAVGAIQIVQHLLQMRELTVEPEVIAEMTADQLAEAIERGSGGQ